MEIDSYLTSYHIFYSLSVVKFDYYQKLPSLYFQRECYPSDEELGTCTTTTWRNLEKAFERVRANVEHQKELKQARSEFGSQSYCLDIGKVDSTTNMGRVTRTFTGPDKTAGTCDVKTALGLLTRPSVKR